MTVQVGTRLGYGLMMFFITLLSGTVSAEEDRENSMSSDKATMKLNIPFWTLGGKQYWTDELIHGSWRIQRNVLSDHYRLLDPGNVRRAWGSRDACVACWRELKQEGDVEDLNRTVVILLHGLGRSRSSMKSMGQFLATHGDFTVLNFSYASTRSALAEDAESLARVLSHLEGVERISFVAHSMGNLVVRRLLEDQLALSHGQGVDQRLHRVVMLAPPNNGAALAKRFQNNPLFKLVFGRGGRQFTRDWADLRERLATPTCQFGIIAGGRADGKGGNPLLDGNNDLVVTVEETRLAGARDFVVLPKGHTFIMDDETVQEYTLRFLNRGHFISEERRRPIEK
ncbi:MAG: esterase/lipase family protein [Planctomycetota bacterium]